MSKNEYDINAGQVNQANDSATINATQINNINYGTPQSSGDGNDTIILGGFGLLILIAGYLKYREEINLIMIIAAILIELISVVTYCVIGKYCYKKTCLTYIIFNVIALFSMIVVNLESFPTYVVVENFEKEVNTRGLVKALIQDCNLYVIFQMIGLGVLGITMVVFVLKLNVYLLAKKYNISWLTKIMTIRREEKTVILFYLIFMVIGITAYTGLLPYAFELINQCFG